VSRAINDYAALTIQLSTLYQHTFLLGTRDVAKKPLHERHLARSGFGKSKAAKLDNPSDVVLRERGHGAVLGDEGKAVGCRIPAALLSERKISAQKEAAWRVEFEVLGEQLVFRNVQRVRSTAIISLRGKRDIAAKLLTKDEARRIATNFA
jgi:hypothetical protein